MKDKLTSERMEKDESCKTAEEENLALSDEQMETIAAGSIRPPSFRPHHKSPRSNIVRIIALC